MKQLIVIIGVSLFVGGYAQTDKFNNQKYWKFRNEMVTDFVKVGRSDGESITIVARKPTKCPNNLDYDDTDPEGSQRGMLRWGDGMIFQESYTKLIPKKTGFLPKHTTLRNKNTKNLRNKLINNTLI